MRVTRDGALYKDVAAATQAGFEAVAGHALKQAGKHLDGIRGGDASASPSEFRNRTPCAFCDQRPACPFDPRLDAAQVRRFSKMKPAEALERIILEDEK